MPLHTLPSLSGNTLHEPFLSEAAYVSAFLHSNLSKHRNRLRTQWDGEAMFQRSRYLSILYDFQFILEVG